METALCLQEKPNRHELDNRTAYFILEGERLGYLIKKKTILDMYNFYVENDYAHSRFTNSKRRGERKLGMSIEEFSKRNKVKDFVMKGSNILLVSYDNKDDT